MKIKHYSLIFSIFGTVLLYLLSLASEPNRIDLNELEKFEGKNILTSGIVKDFYQTKHGSQIITIQDENNSAIVFSEEYFEVEFGDKIQVEGEVQNYNDEWEIVVNNNRNIKILKKWKNISSPIWQIAQNPFKYLGSNVNISGHVDSVYDSYFILRDIDSNSALIVNHNSTFKPYIYSGKKVCVYAKFSYDEDNLRYLLEICNKHHGIFMPLGG